MSTQSEGQQAPVNVLINKHVTDSQKEPLLSGSQSSDNTISVEDRASSSQSHSTVGEAEQLKKPLVAGSSSTVQTTTGKNEEEIKQPFSESHGTTSSYVAVHTSSSSQSETGLFLYRICHQGTQPCNNDIFGFTQHNFTVMSGKTQQVRGCASKASINFYLQTMEKFKKNCP